MGLTVAAAAWRSRASSPLVIACQGDSVTEGTGVTGNTPGVSLAYQNRWINIMIAALQTHNLGGIVGGLCGFGTDVQDLTGSNPWDHPLQGLQPRWPGSRATGFSAGHVQQCVLPPGTSIDVFGWQGDPITTTFTVTINGTATTITPSTTGGLIDNFKVNVSAGMTTGGNNTVVITGNGGANSYPDGIWHHNGDESAGVLLCDGGHYGWTSASYLSDMSGNNDANHYLQRMPQIGAKQYVIFLGLNDYEAQVAINTWTSDIQAMIALNTGWVANASTLLIGAYRRTDIAVQPITNQQYTNALAGIAAADSANISYLPLQPLWDANGGTAVLCPGDGVHPNNVGHALIGNAVANALLAQYEPVVNYPGPPPLLGRMGR